MQPVAPRGSDQQRSIRWGATALIVGALVMAGCSRGESVSSETVVTTAPSSTPTTVPDTAPSTSAPATTAPTSAPPVTTAPPTTPVTAAPTTAPATTAPATTAPATTTTVQATTTTTTQPPLVGTPLGTSGTLWIAGTEEGDPEATSDGVNCLGLYEAIGAGTLTYSRCGPWASVGGDYMWTVTKGSSDRFFAVVWQQSAPFTWVPKMRLLEPSPGEWDSVTLVAADIDGGPNQELVSGIRFAGTGGYLDLDVIDIRSGNPQVVANGNFESATANTEAGVGVFVWTPNFEPGDPLCCPSSWSQYLVASEGGTWTLSEGIVGVPIEDIPATSEF